MLGKTVFLSKQAPVRTKLGSVGTHWIYPAYCLASFIFIRTHGPTKKCKLICSTSVCWRFRIHLLSWVMVIVQNSHNYVVLVSRYFIIVQKNVQITLVVNLYSTATAIVKLHPPNLKQLVIKVWYALKPQIAELRHCLHRSLYSPCTPDIYATMLNKSCKWYQNYI